MATKDSDVKSSINKIEKPLGRLNTLFNNLMDNITSSNTTKRDKELRQLNSEIDGVIFGEIKQLTSFTGDDISTVLVKVFNEQDNSSGSNIKSIEDIFENDGGGAFSFFQERYENQNILFEDLNVICSQLYELKEALNATRDAIVTADDLSQNVSRTIKFRNSSEDDTEKAGYISLVENMESKFDIFSKIKNHIVPNTLQYGKYYVYTVPYEQLFTQHMQKKEKREMGKQSMMESFSAEAIKDIKTEMGLDASVSVKVMSSSFNSVMEHVEVYNEHIALPLVEQSELSDFIDVKFEKIVKERTKAKARKANADSLQYANDATFDPKAKENDFSAIKDCYVKMIDPRKIIPIKILDETIGYYYIHQTDAKTTKSPFTTTIKLDGQLDKRGAETAFLSKITDKIVKSFDKKFLEENVKFKELILNSLIYNDVYKKQVKFQFIPVDYITEFKVNTDEEGNGTSIIYPSLFYAKLYLSLLIFKMITIITKSNDQKIYYIKNSGIDQDVANKVQSVARSIKERQINFNDLLNSNTLISKVGQAKDVFMPVGQSGEKGIEFDILSGQDVQLNTELMEMLRSAFINATGVPSVIMNYVNEADYAKTLVMANAKFTGRIVNHQIDFNNSTTELYRKILKYSSDIPESAIDEFFFALASPKSLNTTNLTDVINNTDQVIAFMIKSLTGENATPTEDDNMLKDVLIKQMSKELLPMLPWNIAEKIMEESLVEVAKLKIEKKKAEESE